MGGTHNTCEKTGERKQREGTAREHTEKEPEGEREREREITYINKNERENRVRNNER